MKRYEQLTTRGRQRRLHALAGAVLAEYDLDVIRYELLSTETNHLYRVQTRDAVLVLRLASPGWRTLTDLQSEAMWLTALAHDTDVGAPQVLSARDGSRVITVQTSGVPKPHHATLMTWVPGRLLGKHLSEANLAKMGALFARLHDHGKRWQPPAGFTQRRFDRMLSRGEADVLTDAAQLSVIGDRGERVIHEARKLVDDAYANLDRRDLRVIHCDLWHDNIKIDGGALRPFDFEDTVWGFRLHDIAMAMLDLYETVGLERYTRLLDAFRGGYERLAAWPDGNLMALQVGRILWRMNWVARFEPEWFARGTGFYIDLLERTLATGRLTPPLRPGTAA